MLYPKQDFTAITAGITVKDIPNDAKQRVLDAVKTISEQSGEPVMLAATLEFDASDTPCVYIDVETFGTDGREPLNCRIFIGSEISADLQIIFTDALIRAWKKIV